MNKKRLIIADIHSFNNNGVKSGHYFALAKNYLKLFENRCKVLVAGGPIYRTGFTEEELLQLPFDFDRGQNNFIGQLQTIWNCHSLMKMTTSDDIIVLQSARPFLCIIALLVFAKSKRNIFLIQYDTTAIDSRFKRLFYKFTKNRIKGIICPNEDIGKNFGLNYLVVSDYIYAEEGLENFIPFEQRKYDFAMIGRISPEKGIVEAAEALSKTNFKVIVAGLAFPQNLGEQLEEISSKHKNIEVNLSFIPDEQFVTYIKNSKYSLMNYQGVYSNRSSGVVLDTIFHGTPVYGHKCFAMQFIEDNNIGKLYSDISQADFNIANDTKLHSLFLSNISLYLKKHKEYQKKLMSFLKI